MSDADRILGLWLCTTDDVDELESTSIEFRRDATLIYTSRDEKKEQKIFLTYSIAGTEIITNQPSSPREERTRFRLTNDGMLELWFDGRRTLYRRSQEKANPFN